MPNDFPEVQQTLRLGGPFRDIAVTYEGPNGRVQFEEDFILAADSNFFDFFSIAVQLGDPQKALRTNNDMVITQTTAQRYFGSENPTGKMLRMFGQDFTVTAVCEDLPENSHLKFDFLIKWNSLNFGGAQSNFISFSAHTYVLLQPGSDPDQLEAKFPHMVDTYAAAQIESDLGKSWEDYKKEGNGYRYFLQPLTAIHLDPTNIEGKIRAGGNRTYVYFLVGVAALIVIIACINFMNLSTARSAERAREVGVRKTLGSLRFQLMAQFLTESILLSFLATCIALAIAYIAMPFFNQLTNQSLALRISPLLLILLGVTSLVVGFFAGSYPAFVLSRFNPVLVMKGKFTGQRHGAWLRNGLVVFQFSVSIALIIGTLVISRQLDYMKEKSLGFDKEKILLVERAFSLQEKGPVFLEELRKMPEVRAVGSSFGMLGQANDFFGSQYQTSASSETLTTKSTAMDDTFANTVHLEMAEGSWFSEETDDSLSVIVNETAAKTMGLKNPVGQVLKEINRGPNGVEEVPLRIIGVVKDFHFQPLHDPITPLTIVSNERFGGGVGIVYLKLKPGEVSPILSKIENAWKALRTGESFKFSFLDQSLQANYKAEQQVERVFGTFSGLAIIIACVGLFGLSAYTTSLRIKEIGIRRVHGATVASIIILLSSEFSKIIVLAFLIAAPAGWYIMDTWLENFSYRTVLTPGTFLLAGVSALVIAWVTVSYQSIKAALANPITSLRSE
jgi:putative ABC transport system permease protein